MRAAEAKDWLRKNYGITLQVKDKTEYATSIPKITGEEVSYHKDLNDYIINRMKTITIVDKREQKPKSYIEALTGESHKRKNQSNSEHDSMQSSDDTSSDESQGKREEENDLITQNTSETQQIEIIRELQRAVKFL